MRKTLKSITDAEGYRLKFSSGKLEIPYASPNTISDTTAYLSKQTSSSEKKRYITCHCFLKSLQNHFYNLKAKLFEIINYIPKII